MTKAPKAATVEMPQEAPKPEVPEVKPEPALVDFQEPVSAPAQHFAVSSDKNVVSELQMAKLREMADNEELTRNFTKQVYAARAQAEENDKPPAPSPVAPRIVEQTQAEMNAGRAAVAKHEEHYVRHGRPAKPETTDPKNVEVFRPENYVPDPKKNQGHVNAQALHTQALNQ